ncbi:MAG: hypothetical protein WC346_14110 [Methanogenium sp.]|jgi:hypothetical protein
MFKSREDLITSFNSGEMLLELYNKIHIQCLPINEGWVINQLIGSGSLTMYPSLLVLTAGPSINSSVLTLSGIHGFDTSGLLNLNWGKKTFFSTTISTLGENNPNFVSHMFLSQEKLTFGSLSQKGIGITLENTSLKGINYNTELYKSEELFSLNPSTGGGVNVTIINDPSIPATDWYVNSTLKERDVTQVPISGSVNIRVSVGVTNGASAGANNNVYVSRIIVGQVI